MLGRPLKRYKSVHSTGSYHTNLKQQTVGRHHCDQVKFHPASLSVCLFAFRLQNAGAIFNRCNLLWWMSGRPKRPPRSDLKQAAHQLCVLLLLTIAGFWPVTSLLVPRRTKRTPVRLPFRISLRCLQPYCLLPEKKVTTVPSSRPTAFLLRCSFKSLGPHCHLPDTKRDAVSALGGLNTGGAWQTAPTGFIVFVAKASNQGRCAVAVFRARSHSWTWPPGKKMLIKSIGF